MLSIRQAKPEDAPVLAQTERLIVKTPGFLVSKPHELKEERFRETITKLLDSENGHYDDILIGLWVVAKKLFIKC